MKKTILLLAILLPLMSLAQARFEYSSFDSYRANTYTKKVKFVRTIHKSGYVEINNAEATVIVYDANSNTKELFEFIPFKEVGGIGHYLGFAKNDDNIMLTFNPDFKIINLQVNDVITFSFGLSNIDVSNIQHEFKQ